MQGRVNYGCRIRDQGMGQSGAMAKRALGSGVWGLGSKAWGLLGSGVCVRSHGNARRGLRSGTGM
jgi:hypothetical protein